MKVLITGANGFIGSHLTKELAGKHKVTCLVRSTSNLRFIADEDVKIVFGDLRSKATLKTVVKDVDYIYHLAGNKNAMNDKDFFDDNFITTKNLLETIVEEKIKLKRFIFISSLSAYDPGKTASLITETSPKHPVDTFGESKLKAHELVESYYSKIPVTIVIAPVVYGPVDPDLLILFKFLKMGIIPELQSKDKYSSFIHVKDLARGMIICAESTKTKSQCYFLANEKSLSWERVSQIVLDIIGRRGIPVSFPLFVVKGYQIFNNYLSKLMNKPPLLSKRKITEMKHDFWICSSQKVHNELGWQTEINIEDGLRETLIWYLNENML